MITGVVATGQVVGLGYKVLELMPTIGGWISSIMSFPVIAVLLIFAIILGRIVTYD